MKSGRLLPLIALAMSACGRLRYEPREAGARDASTDAGLPESTCGGTCLQPSTPVSAFGTSPLLSDVGNPLSLASDGRTLFGALTEGAAAPFALHLIAFGAAGERAFDVPLDLSVSANDHALAVLPSGLAVGYVRTTGTATIETRLGLRSATTGAMLESVAIDTRTSAIRGLFAGTDGLGVTWLRGTVGAPTASFFLLRDNALMPIGMTTTLPVDVIPSSVAQVGTQWFVGAAGMTTMQARVIRVSDGLTTELPAWPAACGRSAGAVITPGCSGALVCWRDTATCGLTSQVVDRCALLTESGELGGPVVLHGGAHPGQADVYGLDVTWTGSEFWVHSEFADGEGFAVFDRFGARQIESMDGSSMSLGAKGDVAWANGCAVALTNRGGLRARRACARMCP